MLRAVQRIGSAGSISIRIGAGDQESSDVDRDVELGESGAAAVWESV